MSSITVLLILSCKKYAHKADLQRQSWIPCLPSTIRPFHVIGDSERCGQAEYMVDESAHIIYTNTKDDYVSLPHKVITAIQAVHNTMAYDYIYKTDDDQIVTDVGFFDIVQNHREGYHYGGHVVRVEEHYSDYWQIHAELPQKLLLEKTTYCAGRFYFLSPAAVRCALEKKEWFRTRVIEDHAMGYALPAEMKDQPFMLNDLMKTAIVDFDEGYVDRNYHIYTECVNCPEICLNALISYQKYHTYPVHVYLTDTDIAYFQQHSNRIDSTRVRFVVVPSSLISVYNSNGHLGTAMLWELVIRNVTGKKIIHFDSDVIFRGDAVDNIITGLYTHDLVGPVRCYRCNLNGRDDIRHQSDVVATYCFGFQPDRIHKELFSHDQLVQMIRGGYCPLPLSILDFFDPVSYLIFHHGGKMKIIDFTIIGGLNVEGSKDNGYVLNHHMDCGHKIIHFSSVGSGINFDKAMKKGIPIDVPISYVEHSLKTLAIYRFLLFGVDETPDRIPQPIRQLHITFQDLHSLAFVSFETK